MTTPNDRPRLGLVLVPSLLGTWIVWWDRRYRQPARIFALAVGMVVWGVAVLVAQAGGDYLVTPPRGQTVFDVIERNVWPIFVAIAASLASYAKSSVKIERLERDVAELRAEKAGRDVTELADSNLTHHLELLRQEMGELRRAYERSHG